MRVLGLVPARGGSRGVPRKNVRLLLGRPLLQYTAEAALAARRLSKVVLSTDDDEIAEIGRRLGLAVPFIRPGSLARDDTPTLPVVQHAVRWLEEHNERFDAICLLQPTTPLRRAGQIDECIDLLEATGADAVITTLPVPLEYNPHWVYFRAPDGKLTLSTGETTPIARRQELPLAFRREGSVYVTRRDVLVEQNSMFGDQVVGYPIDEDATIDINTLDDWRRAEQHLTVRTT
jgi:CMP-N,N'-diacetyllegionaminic acid synthase